MCAIVLVSCGLIQEATCSKGELCLLFSVDNFSSLMTHFTITKRSSVRSESPCCDILRRVGCFWFKFDHLQTWANNIQHVATHRNTVAKHTQHVAPNIVAWYVSLLGGDRLAGAPHFFEELDFLTVNFSALYSPGFSKHDSVARHDSTVRLPQLCKLKRLFSTKF